MILLIKRRYLSVRRVRVRDRRHRSVDNDRRGREGRVGVGSGILRYLIIHVNEAAVIRIIESTTQYTLGYAINPFVALVAINSST